METSSITPPTEDEEVFLVSTRYSLRLTHNTKKIEDVAVIDDDDLGLEMMDEISPKKAKQD